MARTKNPTDIRKPSGLKNDGTPNLSWQKFKDRLDNFEKVSIENWAPEEILGYLLKRYQEIHDLGWALSYSGPPSKCQEIYVIKRVMTTVGSTKGQIIKQYIDWVFETEIINKKKQITSLAYFFTKGLCQKFRILFQEQNRITRTTALPQDYANIAQILGLNLNTYGDLAFAKMAVNERPDSQDMIAYLQLFSRLELLGFDSNQLNDLE